MKKSNKLYQNNNFSVKNIQSSKKSIDLEEEDDLYFISEQDEKDVVQSIVQSLSLVNKSSNSLWD
jgi:hypothetical protein